MKRAYITGLLTSISYPCFYHDYIFLFIFILLKNIILRSEKRKSRKQPELIQIKKSHFFLLSFSLFARFLQIFFKANLVNRFFVVTSNGLNCFKRRKAKTAISFSSPHFFYLNVLLFLIRRFCVSFRSPFFPFFFFFLNFHDYSFIYYRIYFSF